MSIRYDTPVCRDCAAAVKEWKWACWESRCIHFVLVVWRVALYFVFIQTLPIRVWSFRAQQSACCHEHIHLALANFLPKSERSDVFFRVQQRLVAMKILDIRSSLETFNFISWESRHVHPAAHQIIYVDAAVWVSAVEGVRWFWDHSPTHQTWFIQNKPHWCQITSTDMKHDYGANF